MRCSGRHWRSPGHVGIQTWAHVRAHITHTHTQIHIHDSYAHTSHTHTHTHTNRYTHGTYAHTSHTHTHAHTCTHATKYTHINTLYARNTVEIHSANYSFFVNTTSQFTPNR